MFILYSGNEVICLDDDDDNDLQVVDNSINPSNICLNNNIKVEKPKVNKNKVNETIPKVLQTKRTLRNLLQTKRALPNTILQTQR